MDVRLPTSATLFAIWCDVFHCAKEGDMAGFSKGVAAFNSWYRKADCAVQGEYHARVAKVMAG